MAFTMARVEEPTPTFTPLEKSMSAPSTVLGDFGAATTTSEEGPTGGVGSIVSVEDESTWIGDCHGGGGVGIEPGDRRVVAILPPLPWSLLAFQRRSRTPSISSRVDATRRCVDTRATLTLLESPLSKNIHETFGPRHLTAHGFCKKDNKKSFRALSPESSQHKKDLDRPRQAKLVGFNSVKVQEGG